MSVIGHKKLNLQLSFETQSLYMYFFVSLILPVFVLLLSYWSLLAIGIYWNSKCNDIFSNQN